MESIMSRVHLIPLFALVASLAIVGRRAQAQQFNQPILPARSVWIVTDAPALPPSPAAGHVSDSVTDSVSASGSEWLSGGIAGAIIVGALWAAAAWESGDEHPGVGKVLLGFAFGASIGFPIGALIGGQVGQH